MAKSIQDIQQMSLSSIATFLVTSAGWALVWVLEWSCEFVILSGHNTIDDANNSTSVVDAVVEQIVRGTQRGMLKPGDSCQFWGRYDDLTLSTEMVVTKVSASLSIALGAFCVACSMWMLCTEWKGTSFCNHNRRSSCIILVTCSLSALLVAGFQACTHLMVKSDFCEQGVPFEFESSQGTTIVYDKCSTSTLTYKFTFVTMGLWALAAILFGLKVCTTEPEDDDMSVGTDERNKSSETQESMVGPPLWLF